MENKQQTAVEWLFITLALTPMTDWYNVLEKAKAMEKEQIAEAYRKGVEEDVYNNPLKTGNEYYNEQYGK
jgi:hypothetical protein